MGKAGAKEDLLLSLPVFDATPNCEGLDKVNVELELAPLPLRPDCDGNASENGNGCPCPGAVVGVNPRLRTGLCGVCVGPFP